MSNIYLKDKIAVITGAGGGLGSTLVKELEKRGVICVSIDKNNPNFIECDFSNEDEVEKLVKQICSKFDKIDFLYNVAGIGIYKNIEDLSIDEWNNSVAINLTAPLILIKGLKPLLKKSEKAFVLNFGSGMGKISAAGRAAYCASKFGLRGLSLSLAKEFKNENIDISLLTLGSCMTNFGTGGIEYRKEQEKKGKKYLDSVEVIKKVMEITISDKKNAEYILYPSGYESIKNA